MIDMPILGTGAPVLTEHDLVVLTHDLLAVGLNKGDVGTIVHVYADGQDYEVEFITGDGNTVAVATLEQPEVRPLGASEVLHARSVAAA